MRQRKIRFRPRAAADLLALYDYIVERSGLAVAGDYVARIEAACAALATFPERGSRRDDVRPGLRTIGFERRATIVFLVRRTDVVIVRVLYGGQHLERALGGSAN